MKVYKKICITNRILAQGFLAERIRSCDADAVILREKDLAEDEYERLAEEIVSVCREQNKDCILHSFVKTAVKTAHPFIHLTLKDFLKLSEQDKDFFRVIGVSAHSVRDAVLAEQNGASYVTVSHIFPTECKKGLPARGTELLKQVKQEIKIPVYALGGIHPENADLCFEAGADGVCMMSEYMKA